MHIVFGLFLWHSIVVHLHKRTNIPIDYFNNSVLKNVGISEPFFFVTNFNSNPLRNALVNRFQTWTEKRLRTYSRSIIVIFLQSDCQLELQWYKKRREMKRKHGSEKFPDVESKIRSGEYTCRLPSDLKKHKAM